MSAARSKSAPAPPPFPLSHNSTNLRFAGELGRPDTMHVIQYIRELGIRRDKYGMVFYLDVLSAMVAKGFGLDGVDIASMDAASFDAINKQLLSTMSAELKEKLKNMDKDSMICDLTEEFNNASMLQSNYRGKMQRRRFYERCVQEGKWTERMDHLYSVTLGLWKVTVSLTGAAAEHVEERRASLQAETADEFVLQPAPIRAKEEQAPAPAARVASPRRKSSILGMSSIFSLSPSNLTERTEADRAEAAVNTPKTSELHEFLQEADQVLRTSSVDDHGVKGKGL